MRILAGIVLTAFAIYFGIGARAANNWEHPRRDTYLLVTPASFNLQYQDVHTPRRKSHAKTEIPEEILNFLN